MTYIGSCVDPNPLRVERQDPDNFPRLQTRERCALEIAAYVFKSVDHNNKILLISTFQKTAIAIPFQGKFEIP